jgi:hypothetical protein
MAVRTKGMGTRVRGVECPHCLQRIVSLHRHDFKHCFCGYCSIDGGLDYLRYGWGGLDWPEPWTVPKVVTITLKGARIVRRSKDEIREELITRWGETFTAELLSGDPSSGAGVRPPSNRGKLAER